MKHPRFEIVYARQCCIRFGEKRAIHCGANADRFIVWPVKNGGFGPGAPWYILIGYIRFLMPDLPKLRCPSVKLVARRHIRIGLTDTLSIHITSGLDGIGLWLTSTRTIYPFDDEIRIGALRILCDLP